MEQREDSRARKRVSLSDSGDEGAERGEDGSGMGGAVQLVSAAGGVPRQSGEAGGSRISNMGRRRTGKRNRQGSLRQRA